MLNFTRFDLFKLFKSRSFYLFFAVIMGITILTSTLTTGYTSQSYEDYKASTLKNIEETKANQQKDGVSIQINPQYQLMERDAYETMQRQMAEDARFDQRVVSVVEGFTTLSWIFFAIYIGADFTSGYLKNLLTIRHARTHWVLSKIGVSIGFGLTCLLFAVLFGLYTNLTTGHQALSEIRWDLIFAHFGLAQLGYLIAILGSTALLLLTQSRMLTLIFAILISTGSFKSFIGTFDQYLGWSLSDYLFSNQLQTLDFELAASLTSILTLSLAQIALLLIFNLWRSQTMDYQFRG